jgi:uncharacterized membrane protein YccC
VTTITVTFVIIFLAGINNTSRACLTGVVDTGVACVIGVVHTSKALEHLIVVIDTGEVI